MPPRSYQFDSQFQLGGRLADWPEEIVKNEPMLFSCDVVNAWDKGGPITRNFLETFFGDNIPFESGDFCVDSRVHMLMPGWWPCIPGWHHDDVPRSRGDGQPNYENPKFYSRHCLALVGGDIAPTEFAVGRCSLPHVNGLVYKEWDKLVNDYAREGILQVKRAEDRRLYHFNCDTFHQGTQAVGKGWRWFGRISWNAGYGRGKRPHFNELRRQVNVYMTAPKEGW